MTEHQTLGVQVQLFRHRERPRDIRCMLQTCEHDAPVSDTLQDTSMLVAFGPEPAFVEVAPLRRSFP